MQVSVTLGDRLRLLRAARDWSQATVAKRAKLSKPTLSSIESGKPARESSILALAKALEVPQDALEDDEACFLALEHLTGVVRQKSAAVPREVADLLAQIPPDKRAGVVLMLRGMVATLGGASEPRTHGYSEPRTHGYADTRTQGWPAEQRPSPRKPGTGEGSKDGRK